MNHHFIIETNNLTKTFGGKEVIKGCNMHVEKGTIYGFLGANGAGKTTVFKLLSGLLTPTMGRLQMFGIDNLSTPSDITDWYFDRNSHFL